MPPFPSVGERISAASTTARECEKQLNANFETERKKFLKAKREKTVGSLRMERIDLEQSNFLQCIATDDPRLKEK